MKYHIIFAIGFFLTILPFIGIPTTWKMAIVGIIGGMLMIAALIRYYAAYSAQELNQTFADSDPEGSDEADVDQSKNDSEKEVVAQPSPFYDYAPKKIHTRIQQTAAPRVRRKIKQTVTARQELSSEDDTTDEMYAKKNQYEEEHVF